MGVLELPIPRWGVGPLRDVGSLGGGSVTLRDAQAWWFDGVRRPPG